MGRLQMIAQLGVVLILLCLQYHVEAASSTVVTFYATGYADSHTASIYALGLSAPLHINNDLEVYTSIGVAVTQSTASSIFSSYNNQPGYMAILGPAGGDTLFNIYSNIFSDSTAMFSPLLQTMNLQEAGGMYSIFNEKTYWLIPSDQAQVVGIMFFLSQHPLLPMQHTALAYTVNGINVLSTQALQAVAPVLGITGLSVKSSGGRSFTSGAYSSVFPSAPGVVYQLLESTYAYPSQWIEQMVTDTAFINANTTIGTTFTFDYITLQAYIQKAGAVAILPSQNMLTASPVPGIDSVEYQASHDFDSQASNTIATVSTSSEKNFIMAGWVGGWALMQALNKYTGTSIAVKQPFYNALNHAQSMFLVSDLYYGSMGGSCSNTAISQGSICSCRWAGNNVWFHTLKKTRNTYDSAPLQGALFQYAQGTCANIYTTPTASQLQLPRTVHVVGFSTNDNEMMSSMCSQTNNVIETAANTTRFWHHSSHAYRGYCLPTSMSSATSDLSTHQRTYVTTSLMGVIPDNVVAGSTPPSSLILDFMPQTTQLHVSKANFVYLFPTLEQELYVLASYLSGVVGSTSVVCAVVRSSKYSAAITALLTKTFTTFGITPSSGNVNQPTGDLGSSISASCTHTFVIGAASADAAGILGVMQQKSTSVVLMSFEDLTKQYNAFVSAFGGADASVTDRLVFPTNLPRWTGSTLSSGTLGGASALSTVDEFVETLPPEAQTPAAVRAFIVAMLYDQLTMGTSWGQPDMQAALYGNVTLHVGGMTFGPFAQNWGTQGIQNYGAQNISVWSFTRVVDPTARVLEEPMNPSLVYDTATTSIAYDAGAMEKEEDCIERQQSSSVEKHTTTTENPKAGDSMPTASTTREVTSSGMSLAHHSSSSLKPVLKAVLFGLFAVLCALIVYIVILLLLYFGILRRLAIFLGSLACFQCCGFRSCGSAEKAARKMRAFINIQMEEDCNLECAVSSINLVPCSSSSRLTVVFMEVEQWCQLWLRQPEVMSRAVRQFQRCVKRAAVKHSTYVMQRVEGFLIFVCPSADAALIFVREALINIANLDARDVIVMSDEYKQLGCGGATVEGLRLRVAMHTGTTIGFPGPSGRVHIRGAAVDGAVAAACAAGAAGSVVLTATALTECGLTEGDHDVQCVGQCPLNTGELKDALYVIPIDSGATSRVEQSSVAEVQSARRTTLDKAPGQGTGELWLWCARQLEQHYAGMSDSQRIADLRAIGQLFVLPEALKKEYDSDRSEYCELLRGVCQQVASMMECRHGLSPAAKLPNLLHAQEEIAEGSTVLSSSPGYDANRLGAGGASWRSQKELRKRQRSVQLRHFAYSSGEESYPDEDV